MQFSGRLVIIIALSITVLLVSNIIASKLLVLGNLPFQFLGSSEIVVSVSVICFPLGYIISDVLTEVYGFRVARGVIWLGFACNLTMVILFWIAISIPPAGFWGNQEAYALILGSGGLAAGGQFCGVHSGRILQRRGYGNPQKHHRRANAVAANHKLNCGRAGTGLVSCSTPSHSAYPARRPGRSQSAAR